MIRLQARVNSSLSLQWAILVGALLAMGVALGLNLYLDHERIRVREQERLLAQGEIVERIVNKEFTSLNTVPSTVPSKTAASARTVPCTSTS